MELNLVVGLTLLGLIAAAVIGSIVARRHSPGNASYSGDGGVSPAIFGAAGSDGGSSASCDAGGGAGCDGGGGS